jgi:glycosyltransferase involved in cell wall biosynthesis
MNQDLIYSVIVPLYNEEKNVHLLLDKITDVMQNYKYEIILIDDASTDNTVKEILKYNHPNVKLLEFKKLRTRFCINGWFRCCYRRLCNYSRW